MSNTGSCSGPPPSKPAPPTRPKPKPKPPPNQHQSKRSLDRKIVSATGWNDVEQATSLNGPKQPPPDPNGDGRNQRLIDVGGILLEVALRRLLANPPQKPKPKPKPPPSPHQRKPQPLPQAV